MAMERGPALLSSPSSKRPRQTQLQQEQQQRLKEEQHQQLQGEQKQQKKEEQQQQHPQGNDEKEERPSNEIRAVGGQANSSNGVDDREVIIQFINPNGQPVGPHLALPLHTTRDDLEVLLNRLLHDEEEQQQVDDEDEHTSRRRPFSFTLENDLPQQQQQSSSSNGVEIRDSLLSAFEEAKSFTSAERVLPLKYAPLAPFRVRPLTRCSSSLEGHTEAVLCVAFSPDGTRLATGSGDKTVRLWDLDTETPHRTLRGHGGWVLCLAWAPHGEILASAAMDGTVRLWNAETGEAVAGGGPLRGHSEPITALAWQPLHLAPPAAAVPPAVTPAAGPASAAADASSTNASAGAASGAAEADKKKSRATTQQRRCDMLPDLLLATGSKDATVRLWHSRTGACVCVFSGHRASISKVVWSGESPGFLYTASRDTTIKVWSVESRQLLKELKGHAHWVNSLAISTDAVLRAGAFSLSKKNFLSSFASYAAMQQAARKNYAECVKNSGGEKLLSGSDDFTLIFWKNVGGKKGLVQVARMTGHQKLVIHVVFSPDGRLVASASFDKSIRLWDGQTGRYVGTLRGHVGPVYQLAWSADSRLLLSGSGDSTLKVWNVETKKLKEELYGHADEVYAVDWSCSGSHAASGSKDRIVKIWRH